MKDLDLLNAGKLFYLCEACEYKEKCNYLEDIKTGETDECILNLHNTINWLKETNERLRKENEELRKAFIESSLWRPPYWY